MESKVNYTIVGLFVIFLIVVMGFIILWLSVGFERQVYKTYLVYMDESVAGLSENAPVKFNGVDVGVVSNIDLNLVDPQEVILTLKIKPEVPINENTSATLMEQGITGIAYVGLQGGSHAKPLEVQPGEKYPVIKSAPSFLVRLDATLQNLADNLTSLSTNVKKLASDENLQSIQASLANIKTITGTLAKNDENIDSSLKDLKTTLGNTAKASKDLPQMMQDLKTSAQSIKQLSTEINKTAKTVDDTFKQGNITLNAFNNQLVPQAYDALANIKQLSKTLNEFAEELRQNPAMLIHGKKPPKPGPGEG